MGWGTCISTQLYRAICDRNIQYCRAKKKTEECSKCCEALEIKTIFRGKGIKSNLQGRGKLPKEQNYLQTGRTAVMGTWSLQTHGAAREAP